MDPMQIAACADASGGVIRTTALRSAGATARDIRRACASGAVAQLRGGVYATPHAAADVVTAAIHGGALCCASELARHGVWVLDASRVHVALGGGGREYPHPGCACVAHWDGRSPGYGRVDLERALVQLARCQGPESFFAAFESAWRLGLLSRRARMRIRARLEARHRHLVDLARADADSGLESILRLRLLRLGIPLRCQVLIRDVGRVDFVLGERIILEVDGRDNHDDATHRHKDLVRDANAAALGYITLRFDYALVLHDWPRVQAAILRARAVAR
ncbi:type IV toxin-antitoxin system AbiEi family antitoxin domain-containing protein [Microbacterium oryzae]|uniref:type IV toxin-antitoxin system AbiEi family antitoxin domain-containing protein n=1 Tax=Microbacterium oryzae TaxID=743009 RepID=UPI0025AF0A3C|nr:type IV toxin-antitoxin system AbiEi family antitoxin domain-containing protein [Microbacterium oryzae]MDN3311844.1 type IV toxin-antitoxin system AbiEi family antitoxin domain-containing protein [Microbacterium oryzae]